MTPNEGALANYETPNYDTNNAINEANSDSNCPAWMNCCGNKDDNIEMPKKGVHPMKKNQMP